ncbi:MAG: hypothetical protein NVS1B11_17190 [Terriglobales bacterium]
MEKNNHFAFEFGALSNVANDLWLQLNHMLETRISLVKSELKESGRTAKLAASLSAAVLALAAVAYLLVMLSLVGIIAGLLNGRSYQWPLAFSIVGGFWLITGGMAAYFAWRELKVHGLIPSRTIEVLKGDKTWIQNEVKTRI